MYVENRAKLTSGPQLAKYVSGGRGIVTLESPSGKHHTYEFRRPNDESAFPNTTFFVYVLVKEHTWMYVGMYNSGTKHFRLTRASTYRHDSEIVKGVKYLTKLARCLGSIDDFRMSAYHEGICSVCGRRLTSPKSIQTGMGPHCRRVLCLQ